MQVPQQLIESVRRGEPGAFEELVRSTHRPVYSLVYRIVGNADDAADVAFADLRTKRTEDLLPIIMTNFGLKNAVRVWLYSRQ